MFIYLFIHLFPGINYIRIPSFSDFGPHCIMKLKCLKQSFKFDPQDGALQCSTELNSNPVSEDLSKLL